MIFGGRRSVILVVLLTWVPAVAACSSSPSPGARPATSSDHTLRTTLQLRPVLLERPAAYSLPTPSSPTPVPTARASARPTDASDEAWITPQLLAAMTALDCTAVAATPSAVIADPARPLVTCPSLWANAGGAYLLGPAELDGAAVAAARAEVDPVGDRRWWRVVLTLTPEGKARYGAVADRLSRLQAPRNRVAVVARGQIFSIRNFPLIPWSDTVEITGDLLEGPARDLARQLSP